MPAIVNAFAAYPFLTTLISLLAAISVYQALALPLMEPDALEYVSVARYILRAGTLDVYPVTVADPVTGLFVPSSHPPAFHMSLIFGFVLAGEGTLLPVRLFSLFYGAVIVWLVDQALSAYAPSVRLTAVFLILATPLLVHMTVSYNTDAMRIAAFVAAAVAVARVLERPTRASITLAGVVVGLSLFSHSIGLLSLVFACASIVLSMRNQPKVAFQTVATLTLIASVVGGWQYLLNTLQTGLPIGDSTPVLELSSLAYDLDVRLRRDLATAIDVVLFGVLRAFTEPVLFGITFWLGAVGAIRLLRSSPSAIAIVSALSLALFFALTLATVVAGSDLIVKNPRYVLTLAPICAILGARVVSDLYAGTLWRLAVAHVLMALATGWTLIHAVSRISGYGDLAAVLSGNERAGLGRERFIGGPLLLKLAEQIRPGEVTLTFRQQELSVYGPAPWLEQRDNRLLEYYRLNRPDAAFAWLRAHRVRYVFLPHYMPTTFSRSATASVVGDPRFADPIAFHRGASLHRLVDKVRSVVCRPIENSLWKLSVAHTNPGLGTLLAKATGVPRFVHLDREPVPKMNLAVGAIGEQTWLPGRALVIFVTSGDGSSTIRFQGDPPAAIRFDMLLEGKGLIGVSFAMKRADESVERLPAWEGPIDGPARRLIFQARPHSDDRTLTVELRSLARAAGYARVKAFSACRVDEFPP
jgi:hypothetical protein